MNAGAEIEGLSHRFVEANGLRFHVAECGTGERLALCLHGFPELWYSWRHQMPLLARLGFPVIETPTLMIWGEEDVALSKETTHGTERYVADLTLRYLPGVSHWVQQDDPEAVNAILEAWLTGQPPP